MSLFAVGLVLASAGLHVAWNLILKSAPERMLVSFWTMLGGTLVALPLALGRPMLSGEGIRLALLSGVLEVAYLYALIYAYHRHDFSQVYPIARGTAPAFLALWTALLLSQRPSAAGLAGIALMVFGVMTVSRLAAGGAARLVPLVVAIGVCTSLYQLVDGAAVQRNDPFVYNAAVFGLMAVGLAPVAARAGGRSVEVLRANAGRVAAGSVMTVACYTLVLLAFRMAPVAYVGAAREVSVVLAALAGWHWLGESMGPRRVVGAAVVFVGIALLATAR